MSVGQILSAIGILWLGGCFCSMIIGLLFCDFKGTYLKDHYVILYPIIPFHFTYHIIKNYHKRLKHTKMNLKILMKAMSFMFLPTLGVLAMLLVGFFDPIALWDFIKGNTAGAVIIRVLLFIAELVLVGIMYEKYMGEEKEQNIIKSASSLTDDNAFDESGDQYLYRMWHDSGRSSDYKFERYKTEDNNIVIIKRIKK